MSADDGGDEPARRPRSAVTGAAGYVGSRVVRALGAGGWAVLGLSRSGSTPDVPGAAGARYDLAAGDPEPTIAGCDALVHLAHDFGCRSWAETKRVNVEGSRRLFGAARRAGIGRIVYVSSVAAFPGCESLYGRAKLEIEQLAHEHGASVVRPGLVWGPEGAAMFGALRRVAGRLPVVPVPVPDEPGLVLVHEDDVASLIARLLGLTSGEEAPGPYLAGASERVAFRALLGAVVAASGGHARFVRIPWRVAWTGLRVLEAAGVTPPFRSDSLLSLAHSDPDPFGHALALPGDVAMVFRPFDYRAATR